MAILLANNATAKLAGAINTATTSLTVQTGQGALFPSPSGGDYFPLTLVDSSGNIEITYCTSRSGDILTVTRAREGTSAKSFAAGSRASLRVTDGVFDYVFNVIDNALLRSIIAQATQADRMTYYTGANQAALTVLTPFARTLLDDADASTALSTLGVSAFAKTLLDDSDAAAARNTLDAAGKSGNIDISSNSFTVAGTGGLLTDGPYHDLRLYGNGHVSIHAPENRSALMCSNAHYTGTGWVKDNVSLPSVIIEAGSDGRAYVSYSLAGEANPAARRTPLFSALETVIASQNKYDGMTGPASLEQQLHLTLASGNGNQWFKICNLPASNDGLLGGMVFDGEYGPWVATKTFFRVNITSRNGIKVGGICDGGTPAIKAIQKANGTTDVYFGFQGYCCLDGFMRWQGGYGFYAAIVDMGTTEPAPGAGESVVLNIAHNEFYKAAGMVISNRNDVASVPNLSVIGNIFPASSSEAIAHPGLHTILAYKDAIGNHYGMGMVMSIPGNENTWGLNLFTGNENSRFIHFSRANKLNPVDVSDWTVRVSVDIDRGTIMLGGPQGQNPNDVVRKDYAESLMWVNSAPPVVPNGGDANNLLYREWLGDGVTNGPYTSWFFYRNMRHGDSAWCHQEAYSYFNDEEYFRRLNEGSWQPWRRRWHDGNLPVSNFIKTLLDDADASAAMSTLGVSSFAKTLLDDADATTARATLGAQKETTALSAIGSLSPAPSRLPYFTGSNSAALAVMGSIALSVLSADSADALLSFLGAAKLSSFASSANANGYIKIPRAEGGQIYIQWGKTAAIAKGVNPNVTFPVAFPNAVNAVLLTPTTSTATASAVATVADSLVFKTGFSIWGDVDNSNSGVYWLAIGY